MKNVFVIRHAKSSWKDHSLRDIDRPLNERGLRDAPFMAKFLRSRWENIDLILCSPSVRTRLTSEIFCETYAMNPDDRQIEPSLYEAWVGDYYDIIKELSKDAKNVLIFGHNPTVTVIAHQMGRSDISNVPTCGIVHLVSTTSDWGSFDVSNTTVANYYFPKMNLGEV